jgi:glyoxylase-like metal-dependent hydrolase (beta-lactamase superfamily II)
MAASKKIHTLDLDFLGHSDTIAAYLLEYDGALALVESGPFSTIEALKTQVEKLGFVLSDIKQVFLTHIHFDHAGAAWALADLGATIYVHPVGAPHLQAPEKLYNSAKQIYGDKMEYLWGEMRGIAPERLKSTAHGEQIAFGNTDAFLTAWHTPGHASHHIAWQWDKDLFTGDVAGVKVNGGIVVPPCPPPDIDLAAWSVSIELMKNLGVKTLYLTHYGTVTKVKSHLNALEKRLYRWANWIKKKQLTGLSAAEIIPQYQDFVGKELNRYGIVGEHLTQYESANPAWMSVAGLMRYWKKQGILNG